MPISSPKYGYIKPQMEDEIKKAFSRISPIMNDEAAGVQAEKDYKHIETETDFETYKEQIDSS